MTMLQKDNETGFLFSSQLSIEKKIAFIEHFGLYGNKTKACKEIGINYGTFVRHYRQDDEFRRQLRDAVDAHTDAVEEVVLKMAKDPKGFKDRKMWLEAHRPDKYSPKVRHEVSTKDDRLLGLLDKAKGYDKVIEAKEIAQHDGLDVGTLPPHPSLSHSQENE